MLAAITNKALEILRMSSVTKPKVSAAQIRRLAQIEQRERIIFDEREAEEDQYDENTGELISQAPPDVPQKAYFDALEAWLEGYDPDVLPEAYPQWLALRKAYEQYRIDGYEATPTWFMLSEAFFDACHRNQVAVVLPKSVKELAEVDKMSEIAIARTWKLYGADGEPSAALVQEELREPGKVVTEEHKQWWLDTVRRLMRGDMVTERTREAKPSIAKLPGIEELLKARASIQQVATVMAARYGQPGEPQDDEPWKKIVAAIAVQMGIMAPVNSQQSLNQAAGDVMADMGIDAEGQQLVNTGTIAPIKSKPLKPDQPAQPSGPPVDEMTAQAVALFETGASIDEIAVELGIDSDRVTAIIAAATA